MERTNFDADYIRRLMAGEPQTEEHFTRYFGELLTLKLRSRLRSTQLVEDARQETFLRVLRVLRSKGGLETAGALGAFVNSVANNVLFETYRSNSRTEAMPEDPAEPVCGLADAESILVSEERRAQVREVLEELPAKDRELLRWVFFEERDKDEICRRMGVDREYLRVLVHRAKLKFRLQFDRGSRVAGGAN